MKIQTRTYKTEINWKGIGDYLSAARTILEHGSSNTSGPRIHCQGLALELALKFYLWGKNGSYPGIHNLEHLAFIECKDIPLTDEEVIGIQNLNRQYIQDGDFLYPARYRPTEFRIFNTISQEMVEKIISKIIERSVRPELVERILKR